MTAHSLLGASGAYRWLQCPGSFRLSQTAPHRPSSIYAATGSLAHEYIETAAKNGRTEIDRSEAGKFRLFDGHTVAIDDAFIDGINTMLSYFDEVKKFSDWHDVEFRVSLDCYFPEPPPISLFGTVDAAALNLDAGVLEVIDYKNGAGVTVSPVENPQLLFYGAGVLGALPVDWYDRVRTIKLTIVQPHSAHPLRSWELSPVDLLMWVDEVLIPGVRACEPDDAPLNPGSWCRFCPVVAHCPRLHEDAIKVAQREFEDGDPPSDPGDLAHWLDTAERAQLWIDRVRELALDQLQHQVRIPGWELVPTRPTRKWLLPDTDIAEQLDELGLAADTVWEHRVRSPAQMEKALGRTRVGRKVWDRVTPLFEARSTGVKLGRADNPAEDFDDEA